MILEIHQQCIYSCINARTKRKCWICRQYFKKKYFKQLKVKIKKVMSKNLVIQEMLKFHVLEGNLAIPIGELAEWSNDKRLFQMYGYHLVSFNCYHPIQGFSLRRRSQDWRSERTPYWSCHPLLTLNPKRLHETPRTLIPRNPIFLGMVLLSRPNLVPTFLTKTFEALAPQLQICPTSTKEWFPMLWRPPAPHIGIKSLEITQQITRPCILVHILVVIPFILLLVQYPWLLRITPGAIPLQANPWPINTLGTPGCTPRCLTTVQTKIQLLPKSQLKNPAVRNCVWKLLMTLVKK